MPRGVSDNGVANGVDNEAIVRYSQRDARVSEEVSVKVSRERHAMCTYTKGRGVQYHAYRAYPAL